MSENRYQDQQGYILGRYYLNWGEAIWGILKARYDELRWKVRRALETSYPPKSDIYRKEERLSKPFRSIQKSPYKGNSTVVIDKMEKIVS